MSKIENPLIHQYWKKVGGILVEEFPIIQKSKHSGRRVIDAIIVPDGENKILNWSQVSLKGKDIICVQAKKGRLGMSLMGQTFFFRTATKKA